MSSSVGRLVGLGGIVVFACYGYMPIHALTNMHVDSMYDNYVQTNLVGLTPT